MQTKDEANIKARAYLREHPDAKARELKEGIGCSLGLVSGLPAWKAVREQRAKGRKPRKAGVVSLTPKMGNVAGTKDNQLEKLVAEQQADSELSPLEDDPPARDDGAPREAKVYRHP
jgi:hypothetical protein